MQVQVVSQSHMVIMTTTELIIWLDTIGQLEISPLVSIILNTEMMMMQGEDQDGGYFTISY